MRVFKRPRANDTQLVVIFGEFHVDNCSKSKDVVRFVKIAKEALDKFQDLKIYIEEDIIDPTVAKRKVITQLEAKTFEKKESVKLLTHSFKSIRNLMERISEGEVQEMQKHEILCLREMRQNRKYRGRMLQIDMREIVSGRLINPLNSYADMMSHYKEIVDELLHIHAFVSNKTSVMRDVLNKIFDECAIGLDLMERAIQNFGTRVTRRLRNPSRVEAELEKLSVKLSRFDNYTQLIFDEQGSPAMPLIRVLHSRNWWDQISNLLYDTMELCVLYMEELTYERLLHERSPFVIYYCGDAHRRSLQRIMLEEQLFSLVGATGECDSSRRGCLQL